MLHAESPGLFGPGSVDLASDVPQTWAAAPSRAPSALAPLLGALLLLVSLVTPRTLAQCPPGWIPGDGYAGVGGPVNAMTLWDPDGPGPQPALVVIGGTFTTAGTIVTSNIAAWNPQTGEWSSLSTGVDNTVLCLASWPSGNGRIDLIAGGQFLNAGGVPASRIARWNGQSWSPLSSGMTQIVNSLAVLPSGDLVAGGYFAFAGGVAVNRIARWNGSVWSPFGSGMNSFTYVRALAVLAGGDLVAAGDFNSAGGLAVNRIALWREATGGGWSAMGSGMNGTVFALAALPNGDLVAGGDFTNAGGAAASRIARWYASDGAWSQMGAGFNGTVLSLTLTPGSSGANDVVAGGTFFASGGLPSHVARWNDADGLWLSMGTGTNGNVSALVPLPEGNVVAGGDLSTASGVALRGVARWLPTAAGGAGAWSALNPGMNSSVNALAVLPDGASGSDLVIAGSVITDQGVAIRNVARLSASAAEMWSAFGIGTNGTPAALAVLPNGAGGSDLVAGGSFVTAGGVTVNRIARWDSTAAAGAGAWMPMGTGMDGEVAALAVLSNGDLIAGGSFVTAGGVTVNHIARWSGGQWQTIGPGINGTVSSIAALPGGDFVAVGGFTAAGGVFARDIARWNASTGTWTSFGSGMDNPVYAVAVMPNGNIVVGGSFGTAGGITASRIAFWNGFGWSGLGTGVNGGWVTSLIVLPGGDLVAAGSFTSIGGVAANNLARWNGSTWSALGIGITGGVVNALAVMRDAGGNDMLVAGGAFTRAGGQASAYLARYSFAELPAPDISAQPQPVTVCSSGSAVFSVAASGTAPLSCQWQRENAPGTWLDLVDAANSGPGTVSGAKAATLSLAGPFSTASANLRCIVSGPCGSVTSDSALLTVCAADFNCDTGVDLFDYNDFVAAFEAGAPDADFNHDSAIDFFDYDDFVVAFEQGC